MSEPQTPEIEKLYSLTELETESGIPKRGILSFIATGELVAIDVGRSSKPRWRIAKSDFHEFLRLRSNKGPGKRRKNREVIGAKPLDKKPFVHRDIRGSN